MNLMAAESDEARYERVMHNYVYALKDTYEMNP